MGYSLQWRRPQYGSVMVRLAVDGSREISREFEVIAGQGHPKSSILVSIESAYVTSY